jgi:hypothetical protein
MMDAAIFGLLGTAIGALASFGGTFISNQYTLQKERETRDEQRRAESEKWQREQIQNALLQATSAINLYITERLGRKLEEAQRDPHVVALSAEVKKWVVVTLMSYPHKDMQEFKELLRHTHEANFEAVIQEDHAWEMRQLLIKLAVQYQTSGAAFAAAAMA